MDKEKKYKNRKDWLLHEPLRARKVKYTDLTLEQRISLRRIQNDKLKNGLITKECYEELVKQYPLPEEIEE